MSKDKQNFALKIFVLLFKIAILAIFLPSILMICIIVWFFEPREIFRDIKYLFLDAYKLIMDDNSIK